MIRRLALWLLRRDIAARIAAAQRLADQAYRQEHEGGKRGRAWWNGYQRGLEALRDSERL